MRARYYRKQYLQTMESIRRCQNQIRSQLVRARVEHELKTRAATLIQSNIRGQWKRQYFKDAVDQVIKLQSTCKRKLILEYVDEQFTRMATIIIQGHIRSYGHKRYYRSLKKSSVLMQSVIRRQLAQNKYAELKREAEERYIKANFGIGLLEEAIEFRNSFILGLETLNDSYTKLTQLLHGDLSNVPSEERHEYEMIVSGYNSKLSELKTLQGEIMSTLDEQNNLKERRKKQSSMIRSHEQELTATKGKKFLSLGNEIDMMKQELLFIKNVITQDFAPTYSNNKNDKMKGLGITGQQKRSKLVNVIRRESGNPDLLELLMDLNGYTLEITESFLKKINVAELDENRALGPVQAISTVVNSLVRHGLLIQTSKFMSKVLLTFENIVMNLPKDQTMVGGIFWLSNLSRFPPFVANQKTLYDGNGKDEKDRLALLYLNELENESVRVFDKIYSIWLVKLMKHVSVNMNISELMLDEKTFTNPRDEKFAEIRVFLDKFDSAMHQFKVGGTVRTKIYNDILKYLNVLLFNDLITKCPTLNWKYGHEVDKNIKQLMAWFEPKTDGARSNLIQTVQSVKILQMKIGNLKEFKLLFDFWYALNPAQIQAILLKYKPTSKNEVGVPNEILNYLANLVKRENSALPGKMEIMLTADFDSIKKHLHDGADEIPRGFNAEGLTIVNKIIELSLE